MTVPGKRLSKKKGRSRMPYIKFLNLMLLSTLIISCSNGGKMTGKTTPFLSIKDVPASAWEKLSQKKIFFGHQSVGFNIIDGIKDVIKENPRIKLNIEETSNPSDFNSGVFAHSRVGKNQDPGSKIDEFVTLLGNGIGDKIDVATLKFCFVDITSGSNVEDIFNDYDSSISQLKTRFPHVTFIHFTTPLTTIQTGPRAWIKELIGRPAGGTDDNIKKNEYNELLLKKYRGKESVFDLAKIESTFPNGVRASFTEDGKTYYCLAPEYTNDGGHLNEIGRKVVAEQLLVFLANLP
jgi:hypothetical protein